MQQPGKLVSMVVMLLLVCTYPSKSEGGASEEFLWPAPESGIFLLAPAGGWSVGSHLNGPLVAMRGIIAFDNFMGGLQGQAVFIENGVMYTFGVDLNGRYGPIFGGLGFSGHFMPGRTENPDPALTFQLGIHIPTPLPGTFAELCYRPNIVFLSYRERVYHTFMLGLVFETGQ